MDEIECVAGCGPKLFIKIPAQVWNEQDTGPDFLNTIRNPSSLWKSESSPTITSHDAPTESVYSTPVARPRTTKPWQARKSRSSNPAAVAKRLRKSTPTPTLMPPPISTTYPPTRCRTFLYRFVPGPHDMRLEAPCLQPSCKSCVKWHPNLVSELAWIITRPAVEPLSPILDPRILEPWEPEIIHTEGRRVSDVSVQGLPSSFPPTNSMELQIVHAPITPFLDVHIPPPSLDLPNIQRYSVLLPEYLLNHTVSRPIPAKSLWRTFPRKSYTATLAFLSLSARQGFAERVAKARIKEGHEIVQSILKVRSGNGVRVGGDGGSVMVGEGNERRKKKIRFRYRVRLMFGSEEGRGRFSEVVRGWK
jgi:hypothetical protein